MTEEKTCKVEGCHNKAYAKGECHYHRYKAYQKTDKRKAYRKAYQKTDKYKAYRKAYRQRKRHELVDSYIRNVICK